MEQFFMPRRRAIALIVRIRKDLPAQAAERSRADASPRHPTDAELERLLLDVRAGRIHEFELYRPTHIRVMICPD